MREVMKFPLSEQVFHLVNLITWTILFISGALIYFKLISTQMVELLMDFHIAIAVIFTLNFIGFITLNFDRFVLILRNLLIWDADTFAWFKNLGGYPRRLFGIKFGSEKTAPQGRFNAGQKGAYLIFIFAIFTLTLSGWLLFLFPGAIGKIAFKILFYFHVFAGIFVSVMVYLVHMPMAILNTQDFRAMFSLGNGKISIEDAKEHSPKWVDNDLQGVENVLDKR